MSKNLERYPTFNIRHKNDLAKHISRDSASHKDKLNLINDALNNFNSYWKDHEGKSEPEKNKYVRDASDTKLGKLLKLINKQILTPEDERVPFFIFGGISKKDHVQACHYLWGDGGDKMLLALDIERFFDQIKRERIFHFFNSKASCGKRAANILADLTCVNKGPKDNPEKEKVLARGFATSTRLSCWSNMDTFLTAWWFLKDEFKENNPKMALFVDDIGITLEGVTEQEVEKLYKELKDIFEKHDKNQSLPIHTDDKKVIGSFSEGVEHLGLKFTEEEIIAGNHIRKKLEKAKKALKENNLKKEEKELLISKIESLRNNIHRSKKTKPR